MKQQLLDFDPAPQEPPIRFSESTERRLVRLMGEVLSVLLAKEKERRNDESPSRPQDPS